MGSDQYPPIEDAPGTYVREMHGDGVESEGAQVTQETSQGDPREKEWDESEHQRNFEGRFGPGEVWDESTHTRDAKGRFTR
jgi:hypothetical protein